MQVDVCTNAHRFDARFSGLMTTALALGAELERSSIVAASSTMMRLGLSSSRTSRGWHQQPWLPKRHCGLDSLLILYRRNCRLDPSVGGRQHLLKTR